MRPIGDHLYTTSTIERDQAIALHGYVYEGVACYVPVLESSATTSFFRFFDYQSGDHFYTTNFGELQGWASGVYSSEGVACPIFPAHIGPTTDLFRLFNPSNGDHFYTTDPGERDTAFHLFGYNKEGTAGFVFHAPDTDRQALFRLRKQFGCEFNANVILVAVENFTSDLIQQTLDSLKIAQSIYAKVGIKINSDSWFQITVTEAGKFVSMTKSKCDELTERWSAPVFGLDLFVVVSISDIDGHSAVDGPCHDKDRKGSSGSVVSLNGDAQNSGNTFAHEMGHYLGLHHVIEDGNFIESSSNSSTGIDAWQGQKMAKHCLVWEI